MIALNIDKKNYTFKQNNNKYNLLKIMFEIIKLVFWLKEKKNS